MSGYPIIYLWSGTTSLSFWIGFHCLLVGLHPVGITNDLSQNAYFLHGRAQAKLSFTVIVITHLRIVWGYNSSSRVLDTLQAHNWRFGRFGRFFLLLLETFLAPHCLLSPVEACSLPIIHLRARHAQLYLTKALFLLDCGTLVLYWDVPGHFPSYTFFMVLSPLNSEEKK